MDGISPDTSRRIVSASPSLHRIVFSEDGVMCADQSPQFLPQSVPRSPSRTARRRSSPIPYSQRAMVSVSPLASPMPSNISPCFGDETEMSDGMPHRIPAVNGRALIGQASGAEQASVRESLSYDRHTAVQPGQSCELQQLSGTPAEISRAFDYPDRQCTDEEDSDSIEADDTGFSQELLDAPNNSSSSSSSNSSDMSVSDEEISAPELNSLFPSTDVSGYMNPGGSDPGSALCEDIHSRIFYDYDDERYTRCLWEDVLEEDNRVLRTPVSSEELELRTQAQQQGGLQQWDYDSPFCDVEVRIDDVNDLLERRFLVEANTVLDNVIADISSKASRDIDANDSCVNISPLSCVQTFLSDCLLEKLRCFANRALHQQGKKPTTASELLGLIILHTLCASYDESPRTICDPAERENFFQMGIESDRYHEVWSALSGSRDRRAAHDYSATGWCRTANRTTSMITEVEAETAAINRELLYVPNSTVLSLDDDHLRMASRAVTELTYLQQHNNPKKGLGPVGTAMCSALNPLFIACHFTRTREKLLHTWERLMQLLQGASTTGALRPMPEAILAADRGYNSKESIRFLSDILGATLLGTHKRDLWFPYVFGDGPISHRHNGMVVSEKGCRVVYSARLKGSASNRQARSVEACLYRESCSGRIAAMIHNNGALFPSRCFTVVLKEAYRSPDAIIKVEEGLEVYDDNGGGSRLSQRETRANSSRTTAKDSVGQFLNRVTMLTYLQSEDPVWFLLRAFRFTSRTSHGFIAAVAGDFNNHVKGLGSKLAGRRIAPGTDVLPASPQDAEHCIKERYDALASVLGLRKQTVTRPNSRRAMAEQVSNHSASRVNSFNKTELQRVLGIFGRQLDIRLPKAQLVAAFHQLQSDITAGTVAMETTEEGEPRPEAKILEEAERGVCEALREASVGAWVMKPLVSTMGMKEGSRNEIQLLKALRGFLSNQSGAYARPLQSSVFLHDSTRRCDVRHVRCVGLLESRTTSLLSDSPDAVMAAADEDGIVTIMAVDIKTMTAVATVGAATAKSQNYGSYICIEDVGHSEASNELFRDLVPSTQYRSQVLHHAATLGDNNVMYVVGSGGSMTEGRIIYACNIQFAEPFRHKYTYALDCVRRTAFEWIGGEAKYIPKEFDSHLKHCHASDIHSFMSYYNLSEALRKAVIDRGAPIPPCRMIRLTPTVYWNHLKGG